MSNRSSNTIHGGISPPKYHHSFFSQIDVLIRVTGVVHFFIDVGNEVIERFVNAGQILAREPTLHCLVGTHAQKHGIIICQELIDSDVATDLGIELKLDTHPLKYLAAALHNLFFQFELGNAEG